MLLWIPRSASPTPHHPHHHNHHYHHHHHNDDNEKGDKLRRRAAQARTRNILMAVGLFLLAFFATVSQVQYTQKRHNARPSLRIPGGAGLAPREEKEDEMTPEQEAQAVVPPKEKVVEEKLSKEEEEVASLDDFFMPHAHLPENSIYRLTMTDVTGNSIDLSQFSGMVSLVVNTACHWGKTRLEMRELAVLHEELSDEGFSVLAFPTNDFHQELESNEAVANFWSNEFPEATFPIFSLSSLEDNPVYQRIRQHLPDQHVKHNFFKFLVNREGVAVKMFTKKQDPLSLKEEIKQFLQDTSK